MAKQKRIHHQFGLFGFVRPKKKMPKVPITKARIEQATREMKNGNYDNAATVLREFNDYLERIERSL